MSPPLNEVSEKTSWTGVSECVVSKCRVRRGGAAVTRGTLRSAARRVDNQAVPVLYRSGGRFPQRGDVSRAYDRAGIVSGRRRIPAPRSASANADVATTAGKNHPGADPLGRTEKALWLACLCTFSRRRAAAGLWEVAVPDGGIGWAVAGGTGGGTTGTTGAGAGGAGATGTGAGADAGTSGAGAAGTGAGAGCETGAGTGAGTGTAGGAGTGGGGRRTEGVDMVAATAAGGGGGTAAVVGELPDRVWRMVMTVLTPWRKTVPHGGPKPPP